jgi:hypothetical protein
VPPALADLDYKIRAASLRWCVAELAREEIERILAGEQPTGLDLGKLQSKVTPEAVQEWRSQHPDLWREAAVQHGAGAAVGVPRRTLRS